MDGMDPSTGEIVPLEPRIAPALAAAIVAVKKQVKQLGTDGRNEHGKYNFVSVDKIYATIGKLMADAGLALLIDETSTEVRGNEKTGSPWLFASYACRFIHESGAVSPPMRRGIALPISGPQAFGAAQSYIEKQLLRQVFKVPTGERDADETNPSDDAPAARTGRATAPGAPRATSGAPQRSQATQEPSEAKLAANARWKEMRAEIDASMSVTDARSLDGCPAWVTLEKMIAAIETPETTEQAMVALRDRIAKRVLMLEGGEDGEY